MNYSKIFRMLSIRWIIGSALMVFAALGVVQHSGAASISVLAVVNGCLLYTSPSPRDTNPSRMPSSA